MISKWENGCDIINMTRTYSTNTSLFKRKSSDYFYLILSKISDIEMKKGESDFKLIDKSVLKVIKRFNEDSLFLRGLYRWIGFKQIYIQYESAERNAGETNYNSTKLFRLAISGITSFSEKPLHIATYLGILFTVLSVVFFTFDVVTSLIYNRAISGWSSIIVAIVFFGGMQMSILGIIGLYIGKVFKQVKDRPSYIVRNKNF
jgi:dolichol-phosphate mannosyltransferase